MTKDSMPAFSFDPEIEGAYVVHRGKLNYALGHMGLSKTISANTSVHLFVHGEPIGHQHSKGAWEFSVPPFRWWLQDMGFRRHQAQFNHRVAVYADPEEAPEIILDALQDDTHVVQSKRKLKRLTSLDLIAIAIAHELKHVEVAARRNEEPDAGMWARIKMLRHPRQLDLHGEREVRAYISSCINLGPANPWVGVLAVRN